MAVRESGEPGFQGMNRPAMALEDTGRQMNRFPEGERRNHFKAGTGNGNAGSALERGKICPVCKR